jgi:superfamily II DNA/RNA helicase
MFLTFFLLLFFFFLSLFLSFFHQAFVLPIIHSIIANWSYCSSCKIPFAMIISPTRELSMQISSVIKDVVKQVQSSHSFLKIKTVTVIGGMSEDKQRRLLSTAKQALHIIIATPGRLNEILEDDRIEAFQDLSQIKYLVIDEADRMMEDGHFPELYRIFSRMKDHDDIVRRGERVKDVLRKRREGVPEEEYEGQKKDGEGEEEDFDVPVDYPGSDNEGNGEDEQMVGEGDEAQEIDDENEMVPEEEEEFNQMEENTEMMNEEQEPEQSFSLERQTLLFTATGLETEKNKSTLQKSYLTAKQSKKMKLKGTVKGLATNCSLPTAIKE